jgi:hypothetical protein
MDDPVEKSRELAQKVYEISKKNIVLTGCILIIILILVVVPIVRRFRNSLREVYCSSCYHDFRNQIVNISGRARVSYDNITMSRDGSFTYSLWVYIRNWYHNNNSWKHVFHVGSDLDSSCGKDLSWNQVYYQCPGVWLSPVVNDMRIVFQTKIEKSKKCLDEKEMQNVKEVTKCQAGRQCGITQPDEVEFLEYIDINNVPVGEWFMISLVVVKNKVEFYQNGKLYLTKLLIGDPVLNKGNCIFGLGGSFSGMISNFHYVPKGIDFTAIQALYTNENRIKRVNPNY